MEAFPKNCHCGEGRNPEGCKWMIVKDKMDPGLRRDDMLRQFD
jgi:hypothetical protein